MEKELNIGKILSNKPKDTKLFDKLRGEVVTLNRVYSDYEIGCIIYGGTKTSYRYTGKLYENKDAIQILVPSKEMQDWSKFAWKKGDVLTDEERFVVFKGFNTDDYTEFSAPFEYEDDAYRQGLWFVTNDFRKVSDNIAQEVIKKIENHYGGKLNLSTLQIEQPKPEFKDGDIVRVDEEILIILKRDEVFSTYYHFFFKSNGTTAFDGSFNKSGRKYRLATDSEKQQLFNALAKEGKHWNPDTLQIEDLPNKCEFKPMDWCLMRDRGEKWKLCQFGFCDKEDEYEASYNAVGGNWYDECIPYNDDTKHLLGTTDEWKGGE